MKTVTRQVEDFICEICGTVYPNRETAELCERKPISQDRGVKVGDVVRITGGEGVGELATVTRTWIVAMDWGGSRYHHTVCLSADLIDNCGSRVLAFDQYEPILHGWAREVGV